MADNNFTSKAIELVQQATAADQEKRFEDAFNLYQASLKYFLTSLKYEKNERMKEIVGQKVAEYMTRAEQLKKYLDSQTQGTAPISTGGGSPGGDAPSASGGDKYKESIVNNVIMKDKPNVKWDDVAGLYTAKEALKEAVILPIKFPQLFTGARRAWTGILLYGPPGTGKSHLARAVATEAESTFFTVGASDLISKWQGDSERLLHSLFEAARENKPSIIFVDELDSLLPARTDSQSDSIHRFINQFLQEMDGVGKDQTGVLVLGATNTPWSLDPAVRRRFQKKIHIGLPDLPARLRIFEISIGKTPCEISKEQLRQLAADTEGYSGSDISIICREAIMAPVRKVQSATHFKPLTVQHPETGVVRSGLTPCSPGDPDAREMTWQDIPGSQLIEPVVTFRDFARAVQTTRPTVSPEDLTRIDEYTQMFGQEG